MNLIDKLKIISDITEGKTLSTFRGNLSLLDHNSWYTTFWRTGTRENKDKTISCIKEIMDEALNYLDDDDMRAHMYAAIEGMERLKKTYTDYIDRIVRLDKLIIHYKHVLESNILGEVYEPQSLEVSTEIQNDVGHNDSHNNISQQFTPFIFNKVDNSGTVCKLNKSKEINDDINNEVIEEINKKDLGDDFIHNVMHDNYEMVETYLYSGNNANYVTSEGKNALHITCNKKYFNIKMLKLLYSFHVDTNAFDNYGYDPIYYAESTLCNEALLFLNQNCLKKKLAMSVRA